jgi:aldose 1-epimerase
LKNKYTNTLIGRYTNRLPVGTHSIKKKVREEEIESEVKIQGKNESASFFSVDQCGYLLTVWADDTVSLHGGLQGFDTLKLELLSSPSESTLFTKAELTTLATLIPGESSSSIWKLVSSDGDQGFPGRLTLEVLVALKEGFGSKKVEGDGEELALGSIIIVYRAKVEGKYGKPVVTPINLTQVSFCIKVERRPSSTDLDLILAGASTGVSTLTRVSRKRILRS